MKIKTTEHGTMCEVRLRDRRIRVFRLHDKTWAMQFVRPNKPCTGCEDTPSAEHMEYTDKKKRMVMTGLRLSREAMTGFMNAVATLVEFEQNGVEVKD